MMTRRLALVWLVLAWLSGCRRATEVTTEVVMIGTFHAAQFEMKHYGPDILRRLLDVSKPDVLAIEIRPEDLDRPGYGDAPSDMTTIVLPWAKEHGVPVRPIDWWRPDGREQFEQLVHQLEQTPEGRAKLAALPDEVKVHADHFQDLADATVEYVHSAEFARRDHEVREAYARAFGEGPGTMFWAERAARMNERLRAVIDEFHGKRVVVVAGAAHRGDFETFLRARTGVTLLSVIDLPGFRDATKPSAVSPKPTDELELELLMVVQGKQANNDPDSVDIAQVRALIDQLSARTDGGLARVGVVELGKAEQAYLQRSYATAEATFLAAARDLPPDKLVLGAKLSSFAKIRAANMMDLQNRHAEARAIYERHAKEPVIGDICTDFMTEPFERPSPARPADAPAKGTL